MAKVADYGDASYSVDIDELQALIAELRASRFVASLAQEYVEWEDAQPRHVTMGSGQQFRDALLSNLRSGLAELVNVRNEEAR